MYAQNALSSISQSDAEWRRERDFIDAELTANTIRNQAIKKGLQEGREQGLQQGLQQGREETTHDAVRSFYSNGVSVEIIAKSLGITQEKVLQIVNQK